MATPRHQPLYIAGRQWLLGNNTSIISAKTRDLGTAVIDNMIVANLYPHVRFVVSVPWLRSTFSFQMGGNLLVTFI